MTGEQKTLRTPPEASVLYQAVAYWGLAQQKPVTIAEIRDAFGLTPRSAVDVIGYLSHVVGDAMDAEVLLVNGTGFRRRKAIHIRQIWPERFARRLLRQQAENDEKQRRERFVATLRTWFVSRKPGETLPDALQAMEDR